MAKVKGFNVVSGSVGNITFYTMNGQSQVYAKLKGGPTKDQIKKSDRFSEVRKNNKEFGGCSRMSRAIRDTLRDLVGVADYNLAPAFCSFAKQIQKQDTTGEAGRRAIRLSEHRDWLPGFDFNRNHRFDNLLRIPLNYCLDRDTLSAKLTVPTINGAQHLFPVTGYPLFRIEMALGALSDFHYNAERDEYMSLNRSYNAYGFQVQSDWFPVVARVDGFELSLSLDGKIPEFTPADSLVLSVAVRMGTIDAAGQYVAAKGGGAGKILDVR